MFPFDDVIMDFIEEFKIKLHLKVKVSREITKFALMPCILNSIKPGQNGHYDADDNFKFIFLNPIFLYFDFNSLKFMLNKWLILG